MSERETTHRATATTAAQVEIEVVAWVTKFVGGDGSGRKVYYEPLRPDDTIRKVLRRLSGRFPELHKALWDAQTGDLGEHIEVLVNDAVLDITHSLDSPLQVGDKLALIGQYLGG
jgi:molybdopterin converting factor small subunit